MNHWIKYTILLTDFHTDQNEIISSFGKYHFIMIIKTLQNKAVSFLFINKVTMIAEKKVEKCAHIM